MEKQHSMFAISSAKMKRFPSFWCHNLTSSFGVSYPKVSPAYHQFRNSCCDKVCFCTNCSIGTPIGSSAQIYFTPNIAGSTGTQWAPLAPELVHLTPYGRLTHLSMCGNRSMLIKFGAT